MKEINNYNFYERNYEGKDSFVSKHGKLQREIEIEKKKYNN